jgi:hypothetical protein
VAPAQRHDDDIRNDAARTFPSQLSQNPLVDPDRPGFDAGVSAMDPASPDRIKRVLVELARRHPARVTGTEARSMIRTLRRQAHCSRRAYRSAWTRPETSFGPFASLPGHLRTALADAAAWEMRERTLTTSDRLHRAVHGPVFRLGGGLARLGRRERLTRGWRRPAWRSLHLVGRLVMGSCEALGHVWMSLARHAPFGRTSGFHALWKWAGVDPVPLAVGYVDGIPSDPRLSPVHGGSGRESESCALLGVDFLSSGGELYYIEANFNPGMGVNRLRAHPDGDPVGRRLCQYASERGFRRIVFYPSSMWYFEREMELAWREYAGALGIELEIRDDPLRRSPWRRPWEPLVDPGAENTLYVNSREIPSPLLYVIAEKGLFEPEIESHNARVSEPERIRMARRIRSEEDLVAPEPGSRFPNLIVKDPNLNMGQGHRLFKTDRIPDGVESPPYVMFEFVAPDCQIGSQRGAPGEFAFDFRAYLVVTPQGPVYVGAKANVGDVPIPDRLEPGPVLDIRPYVINGHVASTVRPVTASEDEALEAASLRVGRAIHDFLRRKHGEAAVSSGAA